jgi:hypothetical protein
MHSPYNISIVNPLNPYTNRGVSEDASIIEKRISGISDDFLYSIRLGETIIHTFQLLNEALQECSIDNWDGYGAKSIDFNSYLRAFRFIYALPRAIPIPDITVEPDGEIAFEWYNGKRQVLSVSIGGKGELTYAGIFGNNKTHGTEYFEDEIPKTILDYIRRIFS